MRCPSLATLTAYRSLNLSGRDGKNKDFRQIDLNPDFLTRLESGVLARPRLQGRVETGHGDLDPFTVSRRGVETLLGLALGGRQLGLIGGEGEGRGVVEHVEFRGSVTGYRVRTAVGVIHVDTWSGQESQTYRRGDEVRLAIPADAPIVEPK